jgi:hypothetical protein
MSTTPYRVQPDGEPTACSRCHIALPPRADVYPAEGGGALCAHCFFGQYDVLALFGMIALGASAITGSPVFLLGAVVVQGFAVYAIRRGNL